MLDICCVILLCILLSYMYIDWIASSFLKFWELPYMVRNHSSALQASWQKVIKQSCPNDKSPQAVFQASSETWDTTRDIDRSV